MSVIASVFRSDFNTTSGKVRSLLIPTLVNKSGAIGLSLLPMLLIDKGLSASDSSIVMAVVKASAVIGVFLGASLTDHFVTKRIILASFFCLCGGHAFFALFECIHFNLPFWKPLKYWSDHVSECFATDVQENPATTRTARSCGMVTIGQ